MELEVGAEPVFLIPLFFCGCRGLFCCVFGAKNCYFHSFEELDNERPYFLLMSWTEM